MSNHKKAKVSEEEFIEQCIEAITDAWTGNVEDAVKMYESEEYIDLFEKHFFWNLAIKWSINKIYVFYVIFGIVFVVWAILHVFHGFFIGFDMLSDEISTRL